MFTTEPTSAPGRGESLQPKLADLPTTYRVPRVRERDPFFQLSRAWYYGQEVSGGLKMIRLRDKGKTRGVTLIRTADILALLGEAA